MLQTPLITTLDSYKNICDNNYDQFDFDRFIRIFLGEYKD